MVNLIKIVLPFQQERIKFTSCVGSQAAWHQARPTSRPLQPSRLGNLADAYGSNAPFFGFATFLFLLGRGALLFVQFFFSLF